MEEDNKSVGRRRRDERKKEVGYMETKRQRDNMWPNIVNILNLGSLT